jgi:hypothetical protein
MPQTLMNSEELQQWILRKLGAPLVKVELGADHLADAINDAERWFAAKKGFKSHTTLNLDGSVEYALPDEVDTVLDVAFTVNRNDIDSIVDPLSLVDGMPQNSLTGPGNSMGLLSSYAQMSQYLSMAKRMLGSEMEWWQEGRKLIVLPPATSGTIRLDYKANRFTVEQLNERDHDLVKRMAFALAKETLGRIRSKFDAYPTAQGSVALDGSTLLAEAQAEKEGLEEEISASGYPMGFLVG